MSKIRLKLLTFDAVNTIIKVDPCPVKQYSEVAKKFGMKVDEQSIRNAYENSWNVMKLRYPNYGRNLNMTSEDWWKTFISEVFKNAGYSKLLLTSKCNIEAMANNLYTNFGTKDSWMVMDGVYDILSDLKKSGLKLMVVSNFDERLSIVLSSLKLSNYFDFLVTSLSAQAEKPSPVIFKYALELAGVSPKEAIHIGDSFEEDFIPAKSIGIQPFLFIENNKKPSAEVQRIVTDRYIVYDLKNFRDIILSHKS